MMKLTLSPEAEEVVKRISPKVRAANRYTVKSVSALASALIVEFEPLITPAVISEMAGKLVSRAGRKRALLATLSRVAQTADEKQLRRLENQLQRLQATPDSGEGGLPATSNGEKTQTSQSEKSL